MTERVPLTASGRHQLEEEIVRLRTHIDELREMLEDARADRTADDDERAAALGLLDEHARSEARLAELSAILASALDAPPAAADVVAVGTIVKVKDEDGEVESYTVVTPVEAAPSAGRVSINSPLGQALAGHKVGDRATVVAPSGSWDVEIVSIEPAA